MSQTASDSYQAVVDLVSYVEIERRVDVFEIVMEECGVLPLDRLYASHNLKVGGTLSIPQAVLDRFDEDPQSVKKMFSFQTGYNHETDEVPDGYISRAQDLANTINMSCRHNNSSSRYLAFLMKEVDSSFHFYLIGKMDRAEPFSLESYQDMKFLDTHRDEIVKATENMLDFIRDEREKIHRKMDFIDSEFGELPEA
jgi:hypothetical protein